MKKTAGVFVFVLATLASFGQYYKAKSIEITDSLRLNGIWYRTFETGCAPSWGGLEGVLTDQVDLAAALLAKEPYITPAIYPYNYFGSDKTFKSLPDDIRAILGISFDSTKLFATYGGRSNQILNRRQVLNFDTTNVYGGLYQYNAVTRGTRPSAGQGMLMFYTFNDSNYFNGADNAVQFVVDKTNNATMFRNYNGSVWSAYDTSLTYQAARLLYASKSGFDVANTGGNAYIGFPSQSGTIPAPTTGFRIGSNAANQVTYSLSTSYRFIQDFASFTGSRTVIWPDRNNDTVTMLGNSVNIANGFLRINSSGYLPAADGRNLINISPTAGLAVSGTALQQLRINAGGTAWELFTPGSSVPFDVIRGIFSASTIAASTTQYGYIDGTAGTNGNENLRSLGSGHAGTLKNFYLFTSGTQSATGSLVATLRKNGADTGITITIAAGSTATSYSDLVNTVTVTATDILSIKFVNNATATSLALVNSAIELQ